MSPRLVRFVGRRRDYPRHTRRVCCALGFSGEPRIMPTHEFHVLPTPWGDRIHVSPSPLLNPSALCLPTSLCAAVAAAAVHDRKKKHHGTGGATLTASSVPATAMTAWMGLALSLWRWISTVPSPPPSPPESRTLARSLTTTPSSAGKDTINCLKTYFIFSCPGRGSGWQRLVWVSR